ncbi:PH domain-containing protein [Streptosporangium sp. NPDC048047]|uniref:PH domain-containing protein n=1 Tax=Streptosporangium sp. NPDC048047 TaxID=3155748 RepID=UPI00341FC8FA
MKQVFRSRAALILGWVWTAFAALNAVDLVVRYSGPESMVAGAVLAVITALVYITCLRPGVVLAEDGVLVRNPLRDTFFPWAAVDDVAVSHAIKITSGDAVVRCWTPQTSGRERASATRRARPARTGGRFRTEATPTKGEQAAAELLAGKTHADWVAEQIAERAESARRASAFTAAQPTGTTGTPDATGTSGTAGTSGSGTAGTAAGSTGDTGDAARTPVRSVWAPAAMVALLGALAVVIAAVVVS